MFGGLVLFFGAGARQRFAKTVYGLSHLPVRQGGLTLRDGANERFLGEGKRAVEGDLYTSYGMAQGKGLVPHRALLLVAGLLILGYGPAPRRGPGGG